MQSLDSCGMWKVPLEREKMIAFLKEIYLDNPKLIELSQAIEQTISGKKETSLVAVRSSSTLEDLSKMAGAGLFDSILNVTLHDMEGLKKSIIDVWISLYTERAIISRK